MIPTGLYIHIPFCRSKCLYCDFFSGRVDKAIWEPYTLALMEELQRRKDELHDTPDTIYIGGGTPSLMPDREMERLVNGIYELLEICPPIKEFTIEMNPEDVSLSKVRFLKSLGIDRFSLGVQSLSDAELAAVKRNHDSKTAFDALDILASETSNFSADLIFGLPAQSLESFKNSVGKLMCYLPQHISLYSLMLEEGTSLTTLCRQCRITLPSDDESVDMWKWVRHYLSENGYNNYEISNYARPGYESVHNSRYWYGNPYLGIGVAAHSFDGEKTRRANPLKIKEYINYYSTSNSTQRRNFYTEEILSHEESIVEYIMLRMRTAHGIDLGDFKEKWGREALVKLTRNINRILGSGYISVKDSGVSLTEAGIFMADEVIVDLLI